MSTRTTENINKALKDIRNGKPIVVVDDYDRENEGDVVIAAELANANNLNFFIQNAKGLMCIPTAGEILDRLDIPMMVKNSTDKLATPFTVSIDARDGISTGMSVSDRLKTISILLNPNSVPEELARPGHLFPLRPQPNLLLGRRGHTESSVELMIQAGLKPVSIIAEIMGNNGHMLKGDDLTNFAKNFGLNMISVEEIYEFVYKKGL